MVRNRSYELSTESDFAIDLLRAKVAAVLTVVVLATGLAPMTGCQSAGPHARNGALAGGVGGAAIGALAGSGRGKGLEGALVGAATGGTLGGLLGDSVDQEIAADQAYASQLNQQALANSMTPEQVIEMTRAGLEDRLIINQIQTNGVPGRLTTEQLVYLRNNGVSNNVISAMQTARPAQATMIRRAPVRPVIVEEYYGPPPGYYIPRHGFHHPRHCGPHSGWGFRLDF